MKKKGGPKLLLIEEGDFLEKHENETITKNVAAQRIARTLQNIYLDMVSGDRHEDLQHSFSLREYAEMFMLSHLDGDILIRIDKRIRDEKDWDKLVEPFTWGQIMFQTEHKVSFLMFLTSILCYLCSPVSPKTNG